MATLSINARVHERAAARRAAHARASAWRQTGRVALAALAAIPTLGAVVAMAAMYGRHLANFGGF